MNRNYRFKDHYRVFFFFIIEPSVLGFRGGKKKDQSTDERSAKRAMQLIWGTSDKLTCVLKPKINISEIAYESLKEKMGFWNKNNDNFFPLPHQQKKISTVLIPLPVPTNVPQHGSSKDLLSIYYTLTPLFPNILYLQTCFILT